jgi:hypothetical protein
MLGEGGSGKSARRIAFQIAETLPRGANVPVSQWLFAFWPDRTGDASVLGKKYWLGELRRVKILLVDDHV